MQPIAIAYGLCALIVFGLAVASRRAPLIELGLILTVAWLGCNAIVLRYGYAGSTLLIPTLDAILALCVAAVAGSHQNKVAVLVLALFVVVQLVHVTAFELHAQGGHFHILALNLLFLCQLVAVGGAGVASLVGRIATTPGMAARFSRGGIFARRRTRGG